MKLFIALKQYLFLRVRTYCIIYLTRRMRKESLMNQKEEKLNRILNN